MNNRPFEVLLAEDNVPDAHLVRFLLSNCDTPVHLSVVNNGEEASSFLAREAPFVDAPPPDLILLDLNLPRKDGRQLLREIKSHGEWCRIPVVILSTSGSYREISESYCLGANSFITKLTDINDYQTTLRSLTDFWFKRSELPTRLARGR